MDRWTYQKDGDDWKGVLGVARSDSASGGSAPLAYEKKVRLYDGDERSAFEQGTLTLTSHQLFWTGTGDGPHGGRTVELYLSHVKSVDTQAPSWLSSSCHKVVLRLHPVSAEARRERPISEWVRATPSADHCKLGLVDGGKDQAEQLARLVRDVVAAAPWKAAPKVAASKRYGVGAIVAREKGEIARSRDAIREAFRGDLEELKANAKQMVTLSEAFTAKLRKGEVDDADAAEFQSYVTSLGIADPVTRKACGGSQSKFHHELAAELGRVLAEPLAKQGGMMQLQDVYCLYNRARGTMLISPDDLVSAAALFHEVGAPMSLRTFASGVKVVQADSHGDEAIADKVCAVVEACGSLSPSRLAQQNDISVTLAREQLLAAERLGRLCRDDTVGGLVFYPNRFLAESS